MELRSSVWLLQAQGIATSEAALASKTVSTLNTMRDTEAALLAPSHQPSPAQAGSSQAAPSPSASPQPCDPCPKQPLLHHVPSVPGPGTAVLLRGRCCPAHVGLITEHLLPIAAAQGRFPLTASCEGANFIYADCLQHGRWDGCGAGRQRGDGGLCPRQGSRAEGGQGSAEGERVLFPLRLWGSWKLL